MADTLKNTGAELILDSKTIQIANEIAMDVLHVDQIKKLYGYSDASWNNLLTDPKFDATLKNAITLWSSADNIEKRIRIKAGASVEMALLRFHHDMTNTELTLSSRTEAFKTIIKLAGMDRGEAPAANVQGWSLRIHIGNQTVAVAPNMPAAPTTIEGSVIA